MTHARRSIREAAVTKLTGLTTTGNRVYDSRVFPLSESNLPCIAVYTADENIERASLGGLLVREVDLVVRGYARAAASVEDVLDGIAEEVEVALTSVAGVKELTVRSIETEFDGEGDMPIATIAITFNAQYYTNAGAPGTAI